MKKIDKNDPLLKYGGNASVMTAIVVVAVIVINLIVGSFNIKFDLTKNGLYTLSDDTVTLTKRGATNTEMTFKEGKTHTAFYETPFGSMQMRLDTTRVDINEENDKIEISIDYGLDMNYSHVSDCTINMIIE